MIIHGDDGQIVPIGDSALLSSKIVKDATLKIYPGAPHGLTSTHKEQFNADLLSFASITRPVALLMLWAYPIRPQLQRMAKLMLMEEVA